MAAECFSDSKKAYGAFFKVIAMMSTLYDPFTGEPITTNVVGDSQSEGAQIEKPHETSDSVGMSRTGTYATVPVTPEVQQQNKKKQGPLIR